jgi:deoxyribodipyrimidine photolyase
MKYKVTNKLEQSIRFGEIVFLPKETKILDVKPTSDRFIIEELEELEEKLNQTGGKINGKRNRHLERSS